MCYFTKMTITSLNVSFLRELFWTLEKIRQFAPGQSRDMKTKSLNTKLPLNDMCLKQPLNYYQIDQFFVKWYFSRCVIWRYIKAIRRKHSQRNFENKVFQLKSKSRHCWDTFPTSVIAEHTEKTIFPFPFTLNGIWSWWQFYFRFWTKWISI